MIKKLQSLNVKNALLCAFLSVMTLVSTSAKAEDTTPDYLTFTITKGSVNIVEFVHFAGDESGYGKPSSDFPGVDYMINDGSWNSLMGSFKVIYQDEAGFWAGDSYPVEVKQGDVILFRGSNTTLDSYEKGSVQLLFRNASEDLEIAISGSSKSLFVNGESMTEDPDILSFLADGADYLYAKAEDPDFASIGETTYNDVDAFVEALGAITGKATIDLLSNTPALGDLETTSSSDITLNLNGFTIKTHFFDVYGKLEVNDNSEEETGTIVGSVFASKAGSTVVFNNGNIKNSYNGSVLGTMTINGGSFEGGHSAFYVSGTLNINGGSFYGTYGVGALTIEEGGVINLGENCFYHADGHDDLYKITESVSYNGSVVKSVEGELAEMIGSSIFVNNDNMDDKIGVKDGKIVNYIDGDPFVMSKLGSLSKEGDVYTYTSESVSSFKIVFITNDGEVTDVYFQDFDGKYDYHLWEFDEFSAEVAEVIGETVYEMTNEADITLQIYAKEGELYIKSTDPSDPEDKGANYDMSMEDLYGSEYALSIEDNNYVLTEDEITFTFVVSDGNISKVKFEYADILSYDMLPKSEEETPTDITDVEIVKPSLSKTIKVLKNGKIVIIKNGVTYDLSGSVISE